MAPLRLKKVLLSEDQVRKLINELARKVVEANEEHIDDVVLVGIYTGGAHIAKRMQKYLRRRIGRALPLGTIDITLYRDDVFRGLDVPQIGITDINFSMADKHVILIDDVLYTGRTVRAALDQITDLGRPKRVQLVALVDRGLREIPICPDFVGLEIETVPSQSVQVQLREEGFEQDRVALFEMVKSRSKKSDS